MKESVKRPLAACLACVGALALVAGLAYESGRVGRLDAELVTELAVDGESPLGHLARLIAELGDPLPQLVLLTLACLLALYRGRPRQAVAAAALVVGANLTTQLLKALLAHPRFQLLLGYRQISETSFPSGHATAALAMAFAYILVAPRAWRPAVAAIGLSLAFALGCSIVALHYHYPSDVLGGWLVASAWFFAVSIGLRIGEDRSRVGAREPARAGLD